MAPFSFFSYGKRFETYKQLEYTAAIKMRQIEGFPGMFSTLSGNQPAG